MSKILLKMNFWK